MGKPVVVKIMLRRSDQGEVTRDELGLSKIKALANMC